MPQDADNMALTNCAGCALRLLLIREFASSTWGLMTELEKVKSAWPLLRVVGRRLGYVRTKPKELL